MTDQERYADKIAKLLRKAESTTPEEAESLYTKAQELMTRYAIDEELLAQAQGDNTRVKEAIIEDRIRYTGIYHMALFDVGAAIARANDCKVMITRTGKWTELIFIGTESDCRRVRQLDTSLQIQASGGMMRWWRDNKADCAWMSGMEQYKARRQFVFSFARGLETKLMQAAKAGREAARDDAVERGASAEDATASVALVVRSKTERIQDWQDEKYGKKLRGVSRSYASGGGGASGAGFKAGQRADTGGGKVSGKSRELNR